MFKKISLFLLVFTLIAFAANTDRYYQGSVTKAETETEVIYTWTVTIGADSSDQLHSQPLEISDCNNAGFIRAVVNAVSDVNVYYHFGLGKTWFTTVTATNLDATSSTAKYDPLTTTASFRCAQYVVFEIDGGSTAANAGEVVTLTAVFVKDEYYLKNGQAVDVGKIVTNRPSGWTNP